MKKGHKMNTLYSLFILLSLLVTDLWVFVFLQDSEEGFFVALGGVETGDSFSNREYYNHYIYIISEQAKKEASGSILDKSYKCNNAVNNSCICTCNGAINYW